MDFESFFEDQYDPVNRLFGYKANFNQTNSEIVRADKDVTLIYCRQFVFSNIFTDAHIVTHLAYARNRIPATRRVIDIVQHLDTHYPKDVGLISLGHINGDALRIIDGAHRFTSLSHCGTPVEVLFRLRRYANEEERYRDFQIINKATPIPQFYVNKADATRQIVTSLCEEYQKRYSSHFRPSQTPRIGYLNFNKFRDSVYEAIRYHRALFRTESGDRLRHVLGQILNDINHHLQRQPSTNSLFRNARREAKIEAYNRCQTSGFMFGLVADIINMLIAHIGMHKEQYACQDLESDEEEEEEE